MAAAEGASPLRGQVIFITGAARGIGAETARRAVQRGAKVALVGLEPEGLEALAERLGEDAWWCEADVTDEDAMVAAVDGAVERFGGIDVVLANAGIAVFDPLAVLASDRFERVVDVNLLGVWRTIRLTLPHVVARRGYVIPVASLAAAFHSPLLGPYTATKAAVEALANVLRQEVRHLGVDVGCAYFGLIDTDMTRTGMAQAGSRTAQERLRGGPLSKPVPVGAAAEAILRAMERRSRRAYAPKFILPALLWRVQFQALAERITRGQIPAAIAAAESAGPAQTTEEVARR